MVGLRRGRAVAAGLGMVLRWARVTVGALTVTLAFGVLVGTMAAPAMAASVNYGTPNSAVQTAIVTPMENWAATLRLIIVALALVVALVGLILKNMHHNQQLAQTGSRMVTVAFEGVAVVVFLPFILNLIAGFKVPILP